MGGDLQQQVGRSVDLGKLLLRKPTEQAQAVGYAARPRQCCDGLPFGPIADDHQLGIGQQRQRLDHQPVPLQRDEIADGEQGRPREVQATPRRRRGRPGRNSPRSTPLRNTRTRSGAVPRSTSRFLSPRETATKPSARAAAQRIHRRGTA